MAAEICGSTSPHNQLRSGEFWAVDDVSFELRRGECLGLIGRNGAGKTTLLKMLNGLIKPDAGRIEMRGRIGALIALGAGFNPILTGRENIYVNGSVLGLTKREIDEKIDEIVDFAEIRDFIDSPVQSYSSGMQARLGFAVASSLAPDLLMVDEVLAVGDVAFRMKCYRRILDMIRSGTGVILVSHSVVDLSRVCSRGAVMASGAMSFLGPLDSALLAYERLPNGQNGATNPSFRSLVKLGPVTQVGRPGRSPIECSTGDSITLRLHVHTEIKIRKARVLIHLDSARAGRLCSISTKKAGLEWNFLPGYSFVHLTIHEVPLLRGAYQLYFDLYGEKIDDYYGVCGPIEMIITGPPTDPFGFGAYHTLMLDLKWDLCRGEHNDSVTC
ncbi:MAG TPA: ABC transporter ATP-binding protein [Tepidisphaeraceae bacterium]|nr:ABC transporter ATP-binding protein [Tepidisphaeraceae bacterium]